MKYRCICIVFIAFILGLNVLAQNANDLNERLKNTVKKIDNGDIIVEFSLDCPPKLREIVPSRHYYMYDLWLPYMLHFNQNVKWDDFNKALPLEENNSWGDRDSMFAFLKTSMKANSKFVKNPSPRSMIQMLDNGIPALVRIEKFNASQEAMISRRSRMREKIRSKEQREELLSAYSFNLPKARLYGMHHPRILIGYNAETKEYCIKLNKTTNIWYTEAEMKKILREVHVVSIPQ